jgi:hypothetical protein
VTATEVSRPSGRWSAFAARWAAPSFFDVLVLSIPLWLFAAGGGGLTLLLSDGDAGWHIRTGEWILDHGRAPRGDIFSFTKYGEPWFAWEWLADVIAALLVRAAGLKGLLILSVVLYTLYGAITFRHLVWRGANVFLALPLALLAVGAGTVHALARPHLWTMPLIALSWWVISRDLAQPGRALWGLAPLAALWTNLHGGWVALVATLGVVAVGRLLEAGWRPARRYAAAMGLCLAASAANPYGLELHVHTFQYLNLDWIRDTIHEFKSPAFRGENMAHYEIALLLGLAAAGLQASRKQFTGALVVLFWAHASLTSARHIPLYMAVALPLVAGEAAALWNSAAAASRRAALIRTLDAVARDAAPGLRRTSLWPLAALALAAAGWIKLPWPQDFPAQRFPVRMVERHGDLLASSRVFTSDQWADYLIYRLYPRQRVFFDGRSDFYGEALGREFLEIHNGGWRWRELLLKHRVEVVLASPKWALASLLKEDAGWRLLADDGQAVLFQRGAGPSAGSAGSSLMKSLASAEGIKGDRN